MDTANQPLPQETSQAPNPVPQPTSKSKKPLLVVLFIIISTLLFGGGWYLWTQQNQHSQTQKTDSTQAFPPIPTDSTFPEVSLKTLKGKLIYTRNNTSQSVVSNLDGSNPMTLDGDFAGWSDEGRVFYFTKGAYPIDSLYKKDLESGEVTKLFDFSSNLHREESRSRSVEVSSDGKYAILSHNGGDLSLYDLTKKISTRLLSKVDCEEAGLCSSYFPASWSPDSKRVLVYNVGWEQGWSLLINPFVRPVGEGFRLDGSPQWSFDSSMLLVSRTGSGFAYGDGNDYHGGRLSLVSNLDNPVEKELLAKNPKYKDGITSGVLSKDKKIAFTYSSGQDKEGIDLYDLNTDSIKPLLSFPEGGGNIFVELWLDNNTLLYSESTPPLTANSKYTVKNWALDITTLIKTQLPIDGFISEIVQ